MSLSERVHELRGARSLVRKTRLPVSLKIDESYERISQRYDRVSFIRKVDYDALLTKLRTAVNTGSSSALTLRELRLAAGCLFDGDKCVADDPVFLNWFLRAMRSNCSRISVKRIVFNYLAHFDPRRPAIRTMGHFLQDAILAFEPGGRWPWPALHQQHALFDPNQAPLQLAKLTLGSSDPRAKLGEAGLSGQAMAGGLSVHVFLRALDLIRQRLETAPSVNDVEQAIAWVKDVHGSTYYSAQRGAFANALLLPWIRRDPPHDVRAKVQTFLLDALSDPRIDGGAWLGADERARDVMVRWLAQATLEQFLKVVDRVAPKHQWDFRRAFWNAYIGKGVVANAWVAFGSTGAQVAGKIADSTSDSLMRRFGKLGGAGADQAVLLLSIGDLIVADWSHNGRLRIWRKTNRDAPEFNLDTYAASDLRTGSEFETVHLPPEGWQAKTEAYIRRHTRIGLNEFEYMPRRR
jgi:hypothetical protein